MGFVVVLTIFPDNTFLFQVPCVVNVNTDLEYIRISIGLIVEI
jgi:hypothetical protein